MKLKNIKTFEEYTPKPTETSSNKMVGKNPDFIVIFDAQHQQYNVFYKNKFLISRYNLDDVKSYLD